MVGATAAGGRWTTGRPPDYSRELVSLSIGALPPGLIGAVFSGLDVVLLAGVPLLLSDPVTGAVISLLLSAGTLVFLLART